MENENEITVEQIVKEAEPVQPTIEPQPETDKKKRTRDYMREYQRRKRAKLKEQQTETVQPETVKGTDEPELIQTIEEIKPSEAVVEEAKQLSQPERVYITGRMFLFMINFVAPELFAYLWNTFRKNQQVKSEDIKLTTEEVAEIEPLADEVTKEILGTLSPLTQFLMYLSICYGSKLMFAKKYKPSEIDE